MSKEIIKSVINEVEPKLFWGIPDETIDNLITKVLNSEKITLDSNDGLKNDYGLILSNIANVVTIVAFVYGFIDKKSDRNITINIIIEKFPNVPKSKKAMELIEKILEILKRKL